MKETIAQSMLIMLQPILAAVSEQSTGVIFLVGEVLLCLMHLS